jgi:hypothetical protein
MEIQWSRLVVAYVDRHSRRYGWGNIDRNPLRRAVATAAQDGTQVARYLARNVAGYLAENVEAASLPGRALRSYVSRRHFQDGGDDSEPSTSALPLCRSAGGLPLSQ